MILRMLAVGPLEVNCYIVADDNTKDAIVIDPGDEPDRIMEYLDGYKARYIICTHAHFDHVGAVSDIKSKTDAKVMLHKGDLELYQGARDQAAFWGYDLEPLPDVDGFLREGDRIEIGSLMFEVLHTPGHSPGCICLYGEGIVFTGDTLFAGSVGRTDFLGGNLAQLKDSFRRLLRLPDDVRVLPGHGPETTMKREKHDNPFSDDALAL